MHPPLRLKYLHFERSDGDADDCSFTALAATAAAVHPAVMAEVRAVLDWAATQFPLGPGPLDEGLDWDHDLQRSVEGPWHAVTLTLAASARFAAAFVQACDAD